MSTLVYRNGIIAADTALTGRDSIQQTHITKIGRSTNTDRESRCILFGSVGDPGYFRELHAWVMQLQPHLDVSQWPCPPDPEDNSSALIIAPDGRIFMIDSRPVLCPVNVPFSVAGSGSCVALGALWMGASAIEAVAAAIDFDIYSGGNVDSLHSLPQNTQPDGDQA